MPREDTYLQVRGHLAELSDEQLEARFWELARQVVDPHGRAGAHPHLAEHRALGADAHGRGLADLHGGRRRVREARPAGARRRARGAALHDHVGLRRARGRAPARRRRGLGRRRAEVGRGAMRTAPRHAAPRPRREARRRRPSSRDLEHYRPRRKGWHWRELRPRPAARTSSSTRRRRPASSAASRCRPRTTSATSTRSPTASSPPRSPPAASRTTCAACAWRPGTAPTT